MKRCYFQCSPTGKPRALMVRGRLDIDKSRICLPRAVVLVKESDLDEFGKATRGVFANFSYYPLTHKITIPDSKRDEVVKWLEDSGCQWSVEVNVTVLITLRIINPTPAFSVASRHIQREWTDSSHTWSFYDEARAIEFKLKFGDE